jgi:asparagine synthase (glutamine-hydrolysing)
LRKKLPFTIPLADWLSDPSSLPDFLQDIMLGDVIQKQGIFEPTIVHDYMKKISADGIGPQTLVSEADRVFAVVVFTLWHMMFIGK